MSDEEAVKLIRGVEDPQEASKILLDHALANFTTDNLSGQSCPQSDPIRTLTLTAVPPPCSDCRPTRANDLVVQLSLAERVPSERAHLLSSTSLLHLDRLLVSHLLYSPFRFFLVQASNPSLHTFARPIHRSTFVLSLPPSSSLQSSLLPLYASLLLTQPICTLQ